MLTESEVTEKKSDFSKFEWLVSQAVAQHKDNLNIEAVESYLQAIDLNELSSPWIYGNVIILLTQLERLNEAISLVKKSLQIYPDCDEICRAAGVVFEKQDNVDQCLDYYQKAIQLNQEQPEWIYSKVTRYLIQQKKIVQGVKIAAKGLELYPDSHWLNHFHDKWSESSSALSLKENIQQNLAKLESFYLFKIQQNTYSQDLLDEILSNHVHEADFIVQVADLLYSKKKWEQTVKFYHRLVEIYPKQISWYVKLGEAYYHSGKIEFALDVYQQALAIDSKHYQACFQLINILIEQNKVAEAAQQCSHLGEFLLQENRLEQAINVYAKLVEIQADNNLAYHMLGDIYGRLKRAQEAIHAYHYAISIQPDFAPTYHNLGDVFLEQQNWKLAASAYRHSTRIDAHSPWSYPRLGDALANQGEIEQASECYYRAVKLGWQN
jgi:tetratricopeptide (TPR) repeat protein